MTRVALLVVLVTGVRVAADIPAPNPAPATTACVGKQAGQVCDEGARCVSRQVRRPDYSVSPPVWGTVEVLVCEPVGSRAFASGPLVALTLGGVAVGVWVAVQGRGARRRRQA